MTFKRSVLNVLHAALKRSTTIPTSTALKAMWRYSKWHEACNKSSNQSVNDIKGGIVRTFNIGGSGCPQCPVYVDLGRGGKVHVVLVVHASIHDNCIKDGAWCNVHRLEEIPNNNAMQDKAQWCRCHVRPERKYVGHKVEVTDNGVVDKDGLLTSTVREKDAMSAEQCTGCWSPYGWQDPEPPTYFRNQFRCSPALAAETVNLDEQTALIREFPWEGKTIPSTQASLISANLELRF
ncbi:hypothetical protein EV421DRAFT_1738879 [Armillaria borealis]|uniref:Uncharacterized protein n=1 Tax=Armillaria borealis TaxID=47425 RepID=A0AA39J7L9_9AGAR|nr:hypothetical protein EV421DRAFT_1738879 [Armillaria borealis]